MKRKWIKTLAITFTALACCSILALLLYKWKGFKLIFPDLDEINYVNMIIRNDSAVTSINIALHNENPYGLNIDTLAFELALNDTTIAKEIIPLFIREPGFSKDTITAPLSLPTKTIKNLIKNLQGKDSTSISVKGYVIYQTFLGRTKLKFDKRIKIEVPVPPKIKLVRMERGKFNFKEKILKTTAIIEVQNPGKNIDLQLTDLTYELEVKNTLHSTGKLAKSIRVKPSSRVVVDIPMNLKLYHPLKTAILIKMDKDRLPYTLHLTFHVTENISEKKFDSPVELHVKGFLELKK